MTGQAPRITWISAGDPPDAFPPLEIAFTEPDGLLAAGGDLSRDRLLYAYRNGIFPWYEEGQPILWWSPNPRCVLIPQEFHLGSRAKRALKSTGFELSFNSAFDDVVAACAAPRDGQPGTWITAEMKQAYGALRRDGIAHSVEIWRGDQLVGGLYGLAIGRVFFGESMFSRESGASKAALLALCCELQARDFDMLDCQVLSPHLTTLGAKTLPRADFAALLHLSCESGTRLTLPGAIRHPIDKYLPKTVAQ